MVFAGKMSNGCFLCRKRRVKCDEAKPTCRRCLIYGAPCPGYPDATHFFRSENARTRRRVLKQYPGGVEELDAQAGNSSAVAAIADTSLMAASQIQPLNASSVDRANYLFTFQSGVNRISPAPLSNDDWDSIALGHFIDEHIMTPMIGDGSKSIEINQSIAKALSHPPVRFNPGHLDCLPALYLASPHNSHLRYAMLATACMSLYCHSKQPNLQVRARQYYGKALRTMSNSIELPREAHNDDLLGAIILLSIFEDISGERTQRFTPHLAAMKEILRVREVEHGGLTPTSITLSGFAITQVQVASSLGSSDGFGSMHLPFYFTRTGVVGPVTLNMHAMDQFAINSVAMCQKITSKREQWSQAKVSESLLAMIKEGVKLHNEQDEWLQSVVSNWKSTEVANPYQASAEFMGTLRKYNSRWIACFWNIYFSGFISFYLKLRDCCTLFVKQEQEQSPAYAFVVSTLKLTESMVQRHSSTICQSIPFILGDINEDGGRQSNSGYKPAYGFLTLWPLTMVLNCPISLDAQILQARQFLERIGSHIKLAQTLSSSTRSGETNSL